MAKYKSRKREPRTRTNRRIRVPKVRLVDENGEQLGVVDTKEALAMAQERGLDLVEVSPNSKPPVCRIMDYGKYLYTQSKRQKESKKSSQPTTVKEIKVSAKIEEHDLAFKIAHIEKFIKQRYRVKVSVFFRGREITHTDRGKEILERVIERLGDGVNVESRPRLEGRTMAMLLAPVSTSGKQKKSKSGDKKPKSDDKKSKPDNQKPESDDKKPQSDDKIPEADDKKPESDD